MAVRKIDDNNLDFTFGAGKGNYITTNAEVVQNVITRIKSFKFDYFLDITQNIDWFNILALKDNEELIIREVRRVVQQTIGVARVNDIIVIAHTNRVATIQINFDTIYNQNYLKEVGITA